MGSCHSKPDRKMSHIRNPDSYAASSATGDSPPLRPAVADTKAVEPIDTELILVKEYSECSGEEIKALSDEQVEMKKRMQSVWEARVKILLQEEEYRSMMPADASIQLTPRSQEEGLGLRTRAKLHDSVSDIFTAADVRDQGFLSASNLRLASDAVYLALKTESQEMGSWSKCWRDWADELQKNLRACQVNLQPKTVKLALTSIQRQKGYARQVSMPQFAEVFSQQSVEALQNVK